MSAVAEQVSRAYLAAARLNERDSFFALFDPSGGALLALTNRRKGAIDIVPGRYEISLQDIGLDPDILSGGELLDRILTTE